MAAGVAARWLRAPLRGNLWKHPPFLNLWAGQSISVVGDQITALALPLAAVLLLDASATQMGLLTAASWAPHLLLSLFAGLWVDRTRRRKRLLVAADLGRALVLISVPLAYWLDVMTIEHLIAVALLVGGLSVVFDIAWSVFFLRVVPRADVVEANAKLSTSRSISFVAGPTAAGGLVQFLTAPGALLADALSFVASAVFIGRIRVDEPPLDPPNGETARRRLADGFRFLFGHPLLRPSLGCFATINFFNLAFGAIVILFMARELALSPATIGVVLGAGAVGGVVGAVAGPSVGRTIGMGPAIVVGAVLFPAPLVLFPLATGPEALVIAMLVVGEFLAGVGVMVLDIHGNSLSLLVTPERMRPRQSATFKFVNYGVRPVGALAGGFLGSAIGLRPALLLAAIGAMLGVLFLLASPIPSMREAPAEPN